MATESTQEQSAGQRAATAAHSFAANMKAAGQLVAKQTERTKILQVTLPTAYFALGKSLYAAGNLRSELPDAFKAVDDLLSSIKAVDAQAAGRASGDGLAAKAKAAGQAAMDVAQKKRLQVQSNYALSKLGKLAFEKYSEQSGSPELSQTIIDARARVGVLDEEIARLSSTKPGGFITPKRIVVAAAVLLMVGGGYVMLPRSSGEFGDFVAEKQAAARAKYEPQFQQMLTAGDSAWDSGKKSDAVQHYSQLLSTFCGTGLGDMESILVGQQHKPELARAAGRTVDFLADNGNDESAKDVIRRAEQSDLVVVYGSRNANPLVAKVKADLAREERESDEWLERNSRSDSESARDRPSSSSTNDASTSEWTERLLALRKIRRGMTTEQVEEILGVSDEQIIEGNDPSGVLAERGETLTILKWVGPDSSENGDFIMIGFINGRLKNGTSDINVNAARKP